MSNLQIFFFDRTPKGVGQVCLKFPARAGRLCVKLATQPACNCWETSNTLFQPLLGCQKNFFFGGCSQRLTLKDFTIASWIRDILLRKSLATVYTRDEISHYFGAQISELCICSQSQNIVRLGSGLYLYDYRFIIIIITLGWCGRDSLVYCGGVTIPTIRHIWAGPATTPSQHTYLSSHTLDIDLDIQSTMRPEC